LIWTRDKLNIYKLNPAEKSRYCNEKNINSLAAVLPGGFLRLTGLQRLTHSALSRNNLQLNRCPKPRKRFDILEKKNNEQLLLTYILKNF
jgi:hypothetical protein